MKCYPLLVLAVVLFTSAVANCTLADEKQLKAAPDAQAQESATAKQESDFKQCAEMLAEFTHKNPNPTLTERIEGYYLVAQCQERMGQWNDAMFSYARAVTLGGDLVETATATRAKEKLEWLYKATHNGTLFGIEKVYKKAKDSIAETEK